MAPLGVSIAEQLPSRTSYAAAMALERPTAQRSVDLYSTHTPTPTSKITPHQRGHDEGYISENIRHISHANWEALTFTSTSLPESHVSSITFPLFLMNKVMLGPQTKSQPPPLTHFGPTPIKKGAFILNCAADSYDNIDMVGSQSKAAAISVPRYPEKGFERFPAAGKMVLVAKPEETPEMDIKEEVQRSESVIIPSVTAVGVVPGTVRLHTITPTLHPNPHIHARSSMHLAPSPLPNLPIPTRDLKWNDGFKNTSLPFTLEFDLPAFSSLALCLLFGLMGFMTTLTLLIYFVNFPWEPRPAAKKKTKHPKNRRWAWLPPTWSRTQRRPEKLKPIDKPSKYIRVPSDGTTSAVTAATGFPKCISSASSLHRRGPKASAHSPPPPIPSSLSTPSRSPNLTEQAPLLSASVPTSPNGNDIPIPLTNLPPRSPRAAAKKTKPRDIVTSPLSIRPSSPIQTASAISPPNPFIPQAETNVSNQRRSSPECIAACTAFHSLSPSPPSSASFYFPTADFDAEAQTLQPVARNKAFSENNARAWCVGSEGGSVRGKGEGTGNADVRDGWLARVDGVVGKVVDGFVRWTDERGEGEGLLG